MKVKIKTYNGELPAYLTLDKEYWVIRPETCFDVGLIIDDDGEEITLIMDGTSHLNGGSWEFAE